MLEVPSLQERLLNADSYRNRDLFYHVMDELAGEIGFSPSKQWFEAYPVVPEGFQSRKFKFKSTDEIADCLARDFLLHRFSYTKAYVKNSDVMIVSTTCFDFFQLAMKLYFASGIFSNTDLGLPHEVVTYNELERRAPWDRITPPLLMAANIGCIVRDNNYFMIHPVCLPSLLNLKN